MDSDVGATGLIRDRLWHAIQDFTKRPGGCSRPRLRLDNIEALERWGSHPTVDRPKARTD
jgi:hypothetical protein